MEPLEHYDVVASGLSTRIAAVQDWTQTTPCEDWDARALVAHVVETHARVLSRLDGSAPEVLAADADPAEAFAQASGRVRAALSGAEADAVVQGFTGDLPWSAMVDTLLCADTLLHTWDLSRALGLDDTLDLASVASAYAFLTPFGDAMRSPGGFGPEVPVAEDATAQERLLGFTGRRPDAPGLG